jgi:hypothetical protein
MDPDQVKAAIEALKNNDAAAALTILEALIVAAAGGNADAAADVADPLAVSAEPSPEEQALETTLTTLTGCAGPAERVVFLSKLISERAEHDKKVAALELSSRRELVGELVKLGAEFPSTAFVGEPKDGVLVARLSAEPLADLRARVGVVKASKGAPNVPPARKAGTELVTLSAFDQAAAKKAGMTNEQFAEAKKNAVKRA